MILHCNRCGKRVSTEVPDDTVIGAWIECAECVLNEHPTCRWTYDETHVAWDTACQHKFQFDAGGPHRDGVEHCPYCGRRIEEVTT